MPSERRLHPWSLLFTIGARLRELAFPLIAVLFTAGSRSWGWEAWLLFFIIPSALFAIVRYVSFRYAYGDDELVIRTGIVSRNERHVPFARIQSVDAVQSVLHRALGVVDVRIQTAGGEEPEATLRVLSTADYEEMRARVGLQRRRAAEDTGPEADAPGERIVLALPTRELLLAGFIENRGMVLVAAAAGLLWEFSLVERFAPQGVGDAFEQFAPGRDAVRDAIRGGVKSVVGAPDLAGVVGDAVTRIVFAAVAILVALFAIRLVSMAWAAVRLHGFRVVRAGNDLRSEFGLLTRVTTTIPLRRVQTVTVHEGWLHRLSGRATVRVETAGGAAGDVGTTGRESLAPIVSRGTIPTVLAEVAPGIDPEAADWQPAHANAWKRVVRRRLAAIVIVTAGMAVPLGWWTAAVVVPWVAFTVVASRKRLAYQGWAVVGDAVLFRSGWIARHLTVADAAKVQVVGFHESPFDRRSGMARVRVDTAGASERSHRIDMPYLPRESAAALAARLADAAARTAFRW